MAVTEISARDKRKYRNQWVVQDTEGKALFAHKEWGKVLQWIYRNPAEGIFYHFIAYPEIDAWATALGRGREQSPLHLPERRPGMSRELTEHLAGEELMRTIEEIERKRRFGGVGTTLREPPKKRVPKDLQRHLDTSDHHKPAVPMNSTRVA